MALSYLPCRQPRRPTARAVSSPGAKRTFKSQLFCKCEALQIYEIELEKRYLFPALPMARARTRPARRDCAIM